MALVAKSINQIRAQVARLMRQEEDTVREILKESTEPKELLPTEIEDASVREELDSQLQGMEKYFREVKEVGKRIEGSGGGGGVADAGNREEGDRGSEVESEVEKE